MRAMRPVRDRGPRPSPSCSFAKTYTLKVCRRGHAIGIYFVELLFRNCQSRSEEHTSELQSPCNLVCRLLLEKKKKNIRERTFPLHLALILYLTRRSSMSGRMFSSLQSSCHWSGRIVAVLIGCAEMSLRARLASGQLGPAARTLAAMDSTSWYHPGWYWARTRCSRAATARRLCTLSSSATTRRRSNSFFFFFNDTATTEIYTLSLHDALPISCRRSRALDMVRSCLQRMGLQRSSDSSLDRREALDARSAATGREASWRKLD